MINIDKIELVYDNMLKTIFNFANPIKKSIIITQCKVHIFINIKALTILHNDNFLNEYNFFYNYISEINSGAVWADQDFKSSNHFYNPYKKKGLFGRSNAMDLGVNYYSKALLLWAKGDLVDSLFYLGAALHIIQDMTIPQHANIRLLDDHRQYESYVKSSYNNIEDFQVNKGVYPLDSFEDYIRFNARVAIRIHKKYKDISNDKERFYKITRCTLPLAKRTTAGAMVLFYKNINH